jgi:hypothetical protein
MNALLATAATAAWSSAVAVTTVAGLDFPHAAQAIRITRRVRSLRSRRWRAEMVYAVTSLTAAQAHPARLADWIRNIAAALRRNAATPPDCRRCWASPAREPDRPALAEALAGR